MREGMISDRYMHGNYIGHVGKLPAVIICIDLQEEKVLVAQGGKPLTWVLMGDFVIDPRAVVTGEDIEKNKRGY